MLSTLVDSAHELDLTATLLNICLIDANLVDPERHYLILAAKPTQRFA